MATSDEIGSHDTFGDTRAPRFSRLLTTALGSPFLTTSDLPNDVRSLSLADNYEEPIDGTFTTVARGATITRPSSPVPSFRTDVFSIINWSPSCGDTPDILSIQPRPSFSDAAPSCSLGFIPSPSRRPGLYNTSGSSTPFNARRSSQGIKNSKSLSLIPRIWDVLRDSSPGRKGKRRASISATGIDSESSEDVDYQHLLPLDGEEGELIDDEACFINIRAITGVDIVANLPEEIALHLLSFLDLPSVIACSRVSRTWHRLVEDNAIWRELFMGRKPDGWAIDTRRVRSFSGIDVLPAPLAIDWHEIYRTRAELDRRWMATSKLDTNISEEDKENAQMWEPSVKKIVGHMDSVYCLEFDSSRIITGSRDRTIKVWSVKTGRCLATFAAHRGSVLCLKFDKDWDLATGIGEEAPLNRTGFMVSGSSDCSVCVWNLYTYPIENGRLKGELGVRGEVKAILKGHSGGVLDLRIDENWIVSCSKDALIRVWKRATLELHCTFKGHDGPVNAVGLQVNKVVSASGDGKMILWDITTGERLRTFEGHDRGLACIEFKDDLIVSGSNDCKIKVWSVSTGECIRTLVGHDLLVRTLSFDPKSGRLVSGSYDKTVKVWDLKTGRMVRMFKGCHSGHIFDVKFDCRRIVSTSHDQKIVILDFSEGLDASLFV